MLLDLNSSMYWCPGGRWHNSVYRTVAPNKAAISPSCKAQQAWAAHQQASKELAESQLEHQGPGKYLGCFQDHQQVLSSAHHNRHYHSHEQYFGSETYLRN